MNEKRP